MNLDKLKSILDRVMENPKIKEALHKRRDGNPTDNQYVVAVLKVLGVVGLGVAFFGGRIARKIELAVLVLGLLVELSVLIKEIVIDDPEVQRLMQSAWTELSRQSSRLYGLAQDLVAKMQSRMSR